MNIFCSYEELLFLTLIQYVDKPTMDADQLAEETVRLQEKIGELKKLQELKKLEEERENQRRLREEREETETRQRVQAALERIEELKRERAELQRWLDDHSSSTDELEEAEEGSRSTGFYKQWVQDHGQPTNYSYNGSSPRSVVDGTGGAAPYFRRVSTFLSAKLHDE